jgi:hypothetical protein
MKVQSKNLVRPIILLCVVLLVSSCKTAPPQENDSNQPVFTSTTAPEVYVRTYPSTPEGVVGEFLKIYPGTPENGIQYLSPEFVLKLNETSALTLLPEQKEVSGYIIKQGSSSAESAKSEIIMDISYDQAIYSIKFFLVIEDGRWVITGISNNS